MEKNLGYENLTFKELEDNAETLSWKPSEPGDYIIGKYLKTEQGKGRGEGLIFHHLLDTYNQEVSILGSIVLNKKIERVEPDTIVKIVYNGQGKTQNGRTYNNYSVLVATE